MININTLIDNLAFKGLNLRFSQLETITHDRERTKRHRGCCADCGADRDGIDVHF